MKRFISAVAMTLFAGPVSAGSCMWSDVEFTFNYYSNLSEPYLVLYGAFDFAQFENLLNAHLYDPGPDGFTASFHGLALGEDGFSETPVSRVILEHVCEDPWCIEPLSDVPTLAFARETPEGYVVLVDPCSFSLRHGPSREDIDTLEACMRGDACISERPQ